MKKMILAAAVLMSASAGFAAEFKQVCGQITQIESHLEIANSETNLQLILENQVSQNILKAALKQNGGQVNACITGGVNEEQTSLAVVNIRFQ